MLSRSGKSFSAVLDRMADRLPPNPLALSAGQIVSQTGGIIDIEGLPEIAFEDLIALPEGRLALAADISENRTRAVPLHPADEAIIGRPARATGEQASTKTGRALLGRVVNPLGEPLDGGPPLDGLVNRAVHRNAPEILSRAAITRPLQTGLLAVDAAIPIGRGQRELILGDRQTGKTSLALDTMIHQSDDLACVYCAIGQRASSVDKVIESLRAADALERTIIVVASGDDPPGLQYIAPFAATSMAEHFSDDGQDALIIYDDLTRHADAYRQMSLLLRRPPGREAFPGDIFYLHARLLERATQFNEASGGGSLTALPIVETQAGSVASYIPTNLISITDGQILMSSELFQTCQLPAIDIGLSVSRVGGKAQAPAYRSLAGELKLAYAQFEELEAFARFGTRLDETSMQRLKRGRRVREILRQNERCPFDVQTQYALLLASTSGLLDEAPIKALPTIRTRIEKHISECGPPWQDFQPAQPITDEMEKTYTDDLCALVQAAIKAEPVLEKSE